MRNLFSTSKEWIFTYCLTIAIAINSPVYANSTIFEIFNGASESIFEVYISSVEAKNWGKDRLGENVIGSGDTHTFDPGTREGCFYDIRVVYKSKKEEERRRLNLCELSRVAFNGSGTAPAPANPRAPQVSSSGGGSQRSPADQDNFCAGVVSRTVGLIDQNIGRFGGEARASLTQLRNHLDNNGQLLLTRGMLGGGSADAANQGISFANSRIGSNVLIIMDKSSEPNRIIMGCLRRNS